MSADQFILALDQGTTSSRAILFDRQGRLHALSQKEFRQHYPQPGWVEHDPMEIWSSQAATLGEVISKADLTRSQIAAIGITNQRETTLLWDRKTGKPLHHAIVWQDRRTADHCRELKADGVEKEVTERTGKRLDPYFSATKLHWLLENIPGARRRAENGELCFGTVDSWLVWKLTEGRLHLTDATNASRTLLFNIHQGDWDDALLDLFDIPRPLLPEVRSSSEVYGESAADIPIAGIAGDQHAALFGQACFQPGMAKNTYGTGCFLLMHTGDKPVASSHQLLTTVAWKIGERTEYALEGSVFMGGATVQWLRDEMGLISSAADCERLASQVEDNGGLYLVPAFTGLGAPHWDPYARGLAIGMTRGTNAKHFCRAALEAIAYQSADLAQAMQADSGIPITELRVDGGAARNEFLMQFQSELLQLPVTRPRESETTALGAAYLAGLATGFWESREEIAELWQSEQSYAPAREAAETAQLHREW
ncbi:MAG: glycerol kinase GlpK, partial [Verrucomicrobiales bacterium]